MGLKLRLKPFERVIINGCVVTNGDRRNTMTISSFGQVVKSRDILQEEEAKTPVQKLYFALQSLLIEPSAVEALLPTMHKLAGAVFTLAQDDDTRARVLTAVEWAHRNDFYKALAELRPLIRNASGDGVIGRLSDNNDGEEEMRGREHATAAVA